jgi:hypothetical protein
MVTKMVSLKVAVVPFVPQDAEFRHRAPRMSCRHWESAHSGDLASSFTGVVDELI